MIFNAITLAAGAALATFVLMHEDPAVYAACVLAAFMGLALSFLIDSQ